MINTNKPKRGRPPGSSSFTRVRLRDLVNYLGVNNSVVVSKKWLTQVGLTVKTDLPLVEIPNVKEEQESKIQFTIE